MAGDLFTIINRESLDKICIVPDKIISVYSLEKHVWADSNSEKARRDRKPELRTIDEFQIGPVRPFLNDILRNIAAPYDPKRKDNPIGQGYWVQAEFGSGKSHLLSFLASIALGDEQSWDIISEKEKKAERGRRESIYRFWEEGLKSKNSNDKKGIFVTVKTLVGSGGGAVGTTNKGKRLSEYILDAAKEQLQIETGKNISLYPVELLADRFLSEDIDRYRNDLKKFLKDPKFFNQDEFEEADTFINDIQQNKTPDYKRSCGNKLWRFYTEYLKVHPQIAAETEDILKYMVETILAEGYSGVLLVLDEVSLFMKDRDDQRVDDEKTLVVLANRLAKIHNLPIWTVCAAQQAIESTMGVKNIIAEDRLKLVKLLEEDRDYYDIVLARVREIINPSHVGKYYLYYKRGFSWPNTISEDEFRHFFPFHKPALEILRAVTYELTTARSAIHFMHQTLKHQIKNKGCELIRLWELFDEAVNYEEDPSGVHAGIAAIKTKKESDYRAYESCKRQIDGLTKGYLKVNRDKAIKIIQTLFLYHISRTRQQGITPEDIANSVLIERDSESNVEENMQHYETLADNLRKEISQIVQSYDESERPRYRFEPIYIGINPRDEFQKARDEAESNEKILRESWEHLLSMDEWPVKTRQMTIDLSGGIRSIFRNIGPYSAPWEDITFLQDKDQRLEIVWRGKQIFGLTGMRDLNRIAIENVALPAINTDQTELDFAVFIGTKPVSHENISKILTQRNDPRILLWSPDEPTHDENELLIDFSAYRKLISDWQGKETEDAISVINWVANSLNTSLGRIQKVVDNSYARGKIDALNNTNMEFHVAGELSGILTPLMDRVLSSTYESRDIQFNPPITFNREDAIKVINGIVTTGSIPKGTKPNQNISAAQNFGFGLMIMKKNAERQLDVSDNRYVSDMWEFIDDKLADDGQTMKVETLYKNFTGIGGPKDYGLTKRMVQIFLLCLVREGKVRVNLGPRAGTTVSVIDYSNIETVEFSTKALDSLTELQKVTKPGNWDVLRPYAEKLLGGEIPISQTDSEISNTRSKIRGIFAEEQGEAKTYLDKSQKLFNKLKTENPYETELSQMVKLFSVDISGVDDISLVLYALKDAFSYQAFDANQWSQQEIDDFANRLENYRSLKRFLLYDNDLISASEYCSHEVPEGKDFNDIRQIQRELSGKLSDLKPFIDSEVKLKTELIDTIKNLIHEYTSVYAVIHDSVVECIEKYRKDIQNIPDTDEFRALKILESISALSPAISGQIEEKCKELEQQIFSCPNPSRVSIENQLKHRPVHECNLTFSNYSDYIQIAEKSAVEAKDLLNSSIDSKMSVFLTPKIRQRLEQGKTEKVISDILNCGTSEEVCSVLIKACIENQSVVEIISRYLKRVIVRKVKMSDFKPSIKTIEKDQIPILTQEFRVYLEQAMDSSEDDEDVLPVLQVE
jgi:hypothetical protein